MKGLVLFLFLILLQNLLSAQLADTTQADQYFKQGISFFNSSIKIRKSDNKLDTLYIREEYDFTMLDSSCIYFQKAKSIYENNKKWLKYLECIDKTAKNLNLKKLPDSSISILTNGLKYVEKEDGSALAHYYRYYFLLGSLYYKKPVVDSAIIYYKKSLSLASKVLTKNNIFIKSNYIILGDCYSHNEQFDSSLYYYNYIIDSLNSDHHLSSPAISGIYNKISKCYLTQANYDKAIEYLEKAITLCNPTNHPDLGRYKNDLGNLYHYKGEYDKALECYFESVKISLKTIGENHIAIATTYNNIGLIYLEKGDYNKSLEYLNKSLFISKKKLNDNSYSISNILQNISYNYYRMGDLKNAIINIQKALAINKSLYNEDDIRNDPIYDIAALLYGKDHKFNKAEYYIKKSLALTNRINRNNENTRGTAACYETFGTIYLENNFLDRAIESFQTSLKIYLNILGSHHPTIVSLYNKLGDVYVKKNQYEKAIEYFDSAIESNNFSSQPVNYKNNFENVISEYELLISLKSKCSLLRNWYKEKGIIEDLKLSFETNLICIDLFNKLRHSYKSDSSKVLITENSFDIFDSCIESALKLNEIYPNNHYRESAFDIAEKSKNGILNGVLADNKAKKYADLPDSLLIYEDKLRKEIESYSILISQELENNQPDSIKLGYWQNRLFSLKEKFLDFTNELELNYPKYHNLKFKIYSITVPEIQSGIDDNTAVVEYFTGRNSIKIFTITQKDFNIKIVPIDSSFNDSILKLYKTLKKQNNLIQKKNHEQFIQYSSDIYNIILSPIYNKVAAYKNLIFIPDEKLFYIPFEVLMEKPKKISKFSEYNYLIKNHVISYHYSSTLCFENDSKRNDNYDRLFTGFAPMFNRTDETNYLKTYGNSSRELNNGVNNLQVQEEPERLIFAEKEVNSIDELFRLKNKKSSIFLNENANEYNFKNLLTTTSSKYIHIATHGIANETRPNLSALLFTQAKPPSPDDGFLFAEEILNMNIKSELVVLSACESGIGKYVKGEGMMAINRSFQYAGVRELIFSLWKVSDKHTCSLMIEFYKNVLEGLSYGAALRNAKLKMFSDEISAIPSNWSTFVLMGK